MLHNQIQLIAYPNRIGGNLKDLATALEKHFSTALGGIHILPPYPSNADGGFAPLTHKRIDPAYGDWSDIEAIAARYDLCLDLTLNHISDASDEFQDFLRHGYASPYADLFVHVDQLGPIGPEDLARIHIRKEKDPFREVRFADGGSGRVWCTFTEHQIDLNYSSELTYALMQDYIDFLAARGVKLFRLDAFGYTTKKIGTSCFLVEPNVYRILERIQAMAARHGAQLLPEVHDHPSYQYAIARRGMHAYGFALPPLVLSALLHRDASALKNWLRACPRRLVTVLDTHDGICIPDVEGLLPPQRIEQLIDDVSRRSADPILRRSGGAYSVGAIYQLTCTFFDALQRDEDAYIAARAIQFFTPGIPQVYYVGLLAGSNDDALMEASGEPRDINRHHYSLEEVAEAVTRPVVRRLLELMTFRNTYPAFDGHFELHYSDAASVIMAWRHGDHHCVLSVDLNSRRSTITYFDSARGCQHTLNC